MMLAARTSRIRSMKRFVDQFVRNISSNGCTRNVNDKVTVVTPLDHKLATEATGSPSSTTVIPKIWPVWDARNRRVSFLQVDCGTMEMASSWKMLEVKVKTDVAHMQPDCVHIQHVPRDVYAARLTTLLSQLGYHSYGFHGDRVGQATFYRTVQRSNS